MKVMATFDGSGFSESTLPQLLRIAALPNVEFILLRVDSMPHGRGRRQARKPMIGVSPTTGGGTPIVIPAPESPAAETKQQAVERKIAELQDYLEGIASRLPADVPRSVRAVLESDPAKAIISVARAENPDLIVMATHGHTGLAHVLFGGIAEKVVASAVAPVLLVHPEAIRHERTSE